MSFTYSIFDPGLAGQINSVPDIKLSTAAAIDNSNILIEKGEVITSTMRQAEGEDINGNQILIPEFAFDVISVDANEDTIIFAGDGSGLEANDQLYLMDSFEEENPSVINPSVFDSIISVEAGVQARACCRKTSSTLSREGNY